MKLSKIVLLAFAIVLSAGLALADTVPGSDPKAGLGPGTGSSDTTGTFSFTVNGNGGGSGPDFTFLNTSGTTFFNISLTTQDSSGDLSCFTTAYVTNCNITRNAGMITVLFFNVSDGEDPAEGGGECGAQWPGAGIGPGCDFQFTLNDDGSFNNPGGTGGWVAGATVNGAANVPEPGTMTLLFTGLGTLVARRKFHGRRGAAA